MLGRSDKALISLSAQLLAGHWPRRSRRGPKPKRQPEGGATEADLYLHSLRQISLFSRGYIREAPGFCVQKTLQLWGLLLPAPTLPPPPPNYLTLPAEGRACRQSCLPECHQTFSSSHFSFLSRHLRLPPIRSSKAGIYVVGSEDRFAGGSTPSLWSNNVVRAFNS